MHRVGAGVGAPWEDPVCGGSGRGLTRPWLGPQRTTAVPGMLIFGFQIDICGGRVTPRDCGGKAWPVRRRISQHEALVLSGRIPKPLATRENEDLLNSLAHRRLRRLLSPPTGTSWGQAALLTHAGGEVTGAWLETGTLSSQTAGPLGRNACFSPEHSGASLPAPAPSVSDGSLRVRRVVCSLQTGRTLLQDFVGKPEIELLLYLSFLLSLTVNFSLRSFWEEVEEAVCKSVRQESAPAATLGHRFRFRAAVPDGWCVRGAFQRPPKKGKRWKQDALPAGLPASFVNTVMGTGRERQGGLRGVGAGLRDMLGVREKRGRVVGFHQER